MTFQNLLNTLYNININGGMKLGLDNVLLLDKLCGYPSKNFPSIHVAGTNGKGSVCWKVAKSLELSGYKVGLYTSPHISSFRERIRINSQLILENEIESLLQYLLDIVQTNHIPATFFEITTILSFLYFAKNNVDIAVIEVGLGGRLDATNILTPIISVITSIAFDHCDILGNSLLEIAHEKAGIIKPNIPVVLGPQTPNEIIQIAERKQSPCTKVEGAFSFYDTENSTIAFQCLNMIKNKFPITEFALLEGLKECPPCRMESFKYMGMEGILDVAHNPHGLNALFEALSQLHPNRSYDIFVGLSSNKDIPKCLRIIQNNSKHIHLVSAKSGRAAQTQLLADQLEQKNIPKSKWTVHQDITKGLQIAIEQAKTNKHLLIVCGTFFMMSEVRMFLGYQDPIDSLNMNEQKV